MKKSIKTSLLVFICLVTSFSFNAQTSKREFRAVWVTSVWNLDWPKTRGVSSASTQKAELTTMLDELKAAGFNAVLLQVRPNCDALYQSSYEPWSYWLTGSEGTAPNPFWDPLSFAIEEAHKRGMELHAWLNPYRVSVNSSTGVHSSHPAKENPSWVLTVGTAKILNPGLQQVIDYVTNIVGDIVSRYDVDGIVFDDYFYPYPPNNITNEDQSTFNAYPRGYTNIGDWRRNNVNMMVSSVYNKIQSLKPYVKFGVSPAGIWKNNNPPGITGLQAYYEIFCDAVAWINAKTIDYISPQLYWKIRGSQDYIALSNWWAAKAKTTGRLFFPSKSLNSTYSTTELPNQIIHDRSNSDIHGSIFYRAAQVVANELSLETQLKQTYYKYKSLPNSLSWKNSVIPNVPSNVRIIVSSSYNKIVWEEPLPASDNETARYYVVYRSETPNFSISDNRNILDIVYKNKTYYDDYSIQSGKTYYYAVTALDNYGNESSKSQEVTPSPIFETLWERCSRTNNKPVWFGNDSERGLAYYNGKIYVVSRKEGYFIRIINAQNGQDLGFIDVKGISGGVYYLNDIEISSDGKLLACNLTTDAGSDPFKIYKWNNETSQPEVFISYSGGNYRLGDLFTVVGNLSSNAVIYAAAANSSKVFKWIVSNGTLNSQMPIEINLSNFTFGTVPAVYPLSLNTDSDFYVNSQSKQVTLFSSTGKNKGSISGGVIPSSSNKIILFEYNSKKFIATFQSNNTPDNPNGQNARIIDATNQPANILESDLYGVTSRLGNISNGNATGDIALFSDGNGNFVIFVLATNNGIGAYWCKAAPLYNGGTLSSIDKTIYKISGHCLLEQNYPNPFNPNTKINFSLSSDDFIILEIYDITGRQIETLAKDLFKAGYHSLEFNGSNLQSGVYIYKLTTSKGILSNKMLLVK